MSELARAHERWIEDRAGQRWRVELAPPEPILGTGLGIAPAIQDPQLRSRRLRFTPESTGDARWGRETYGPGVELESFTDSELVEHLGAADTT